MKLKFFTDLNKDKPIKAQDGTQLNSFDTNGNLNTSDQTVENTSTVTSDSEPVIKIYQSPDGTQVNSTANFTEEQFEAAKWTVIGTVPKGTYDTKGLGSYQTAGKMIGTPNYDVKYGLGESSQKKGKGFTFSDLRALNAIAANKIERVPQSMPVSRMTRIDPMRKNQELEKQKEDIQANVNAARMRGPKGSDPTLNVLQNLGLTEQSNQATERSNLSQAQDAVNQRNIQRQQAEQANAIRVQDQNVRIGLRNQAASEQAKKKTQQRTATAQVTNTWLGEKEREQKQGIFSDAQLAEKYANQAMMKDPDFIEKTNKRKELATANYNKAKDLTTAQTELQTLTPGTPEYTSKKAEVDKLSVEYTSINNDYKTSQEEVQAIRDNYQSKLLNYQRDVNRESNVFGGNKAGISFNNLLGDLFKTTPSKKKGGSMSLQDKLYLQSIKHKDKKELQREKQMLKSFVLPEPKIYYQTMKLALQQNKQNTDMFKQIYKALYKGK